MILAAPMTGRKILRLPRSSKRLLPEEGWKGPDEGETGQSKSASPGIVEAYRRR